MEKRLMRRYNLPLRAVLSFADAPTREYKTRNISAGGAFFITDKAVPEGTEVFMSIFMNALRDKQIREKNVVRLRGRVKRCGNFGMAICFDHPHRFAWM